MELGIKGRTAIVGGSSRGLGYATAEGLVREGVNVVICARNPESLENARQTLSEFGQGTVIAVQADLGREDDINRLVKTALDKFDRIDILVNNTGGPPPGHFLELTETDWQSTFEGTFFSVLRLSRLVIPGMKSQNWGRIINITSISVKQPIGDLVLSNAIRAAVTGLAKTMATDLASHGILVNNVCPGMHRTSRMDELLSQAAERSGRTIEELVKERSASIPVGRMGEPEELAALVVFLASASASFITGTTIQVDGGHYAGLM